MSPGYSVQVFCNASFPSYHSSSILDLFFCLNNYVHCFQFSASEVTTLWRYTNMFIIIISWVEALTDRLRS